MGHSLVFDDSAEIFLGTHRIQRVPATEKKGRRHTSFVHIRKVVSENNSIALDKRDVRTDYFRSSGAGGQHRNKTDSAVRLTHLPTGIQVTATEERSQHQNRAVAWKRLEEKLTGETK
jgi:protein subunit release factor A